MIVLSLVVNDEPRTVALRSADRTLLSVLRDEFGLTGAKGVGEISLDPVPAAIANAIYDAVGVRIYELPITAEKVHRALRDLKSDT
jgi:hypothetical protein